MAALSSIARARNVEPVWVSRFSMMRVKFTLALAPPRKRDLDDAAFDRGGLVVSLDVVAADHVENDVRAGATGRSLGLGDEILGLVVDRAVGAELQAGVAFLLRAGGDDHLRAERLGELNGGGADAGRAAMDQQRLAGSSVRRARTRCARR